jgi:hypothetical protein
MRSEEAKKESEEMIAQQSKRKATGNEPPKQAVHDVSSSASSTILGKLDAT